VELIPRPLIDALKGKRHRIPPVWLMRQAGRYLPEYRAIREQAGSFLNLCFTPDLAAEVTLQPLRRFDFDAAILFSDILVVPHALGQRVWFEEGEGPRLEPVADAAAVDRLAAAFPDGRLAPVYEAVGLVKTRLPPGVALIGFCGAPWTVATYMVAGGAAGAQGPARLFAYRDPEGFAALIDRLVDASAVHLVRQFEAGADAVQLFDTWAGVLGPGEFDRWVSEPSGRVVEAVRRELGDVPVIGFPRGAGTQIPSYLSQVPVNGIGLDWTVDPTFARRSVQRDTAIQGNLDPLALLAGGAPLDRAVDQVLEAFADRPFIFNLGHGIMPDTPIAHVERMLARVRTA
jgi:uroporphyrinogen decarboxylase